MPKRNLLAFAAVLAVVFFPSALLPQDDPLFRVTAAIERYATAIKSADVDALMRTIDVPFHCGKDINIRERQNLRDKLKTALESVTDRPHFTYTVVQVQRFKEFRRTVVDDEAQMKLLDEALGEDGWVVFLKVRYPGEVGDLFPWDGTVPLTLLVRMHAGQAKVVGEYYWAYC